MITHDPTRYAAAHYDIYGDEERRAQRLPLRTPASARSASFDAFDSRTSSQIEATVTLRRRTWRGEVSQVRSSMAPTLNASGSSFRNPYEIPSAIRPYRFPKRGVPTSTPRCNTHPCQRYLPDLGQLRGNHGPTSTPRRCYSGARGTSRQLHAGSLTARAAPATRTPAPPLRPRRLHRPSH